MRLAADVTFAHGRYRLERRLGAGGMASVWLASDERLGRQVAIKVVADTLADDERWLTRFTREARAAAGLSHPSIVHVFDYGVEDGRPYLAMEYIHGPNLAERLADPVASRPDAGRLARELLDALAHIHAAGIVHRDIKPANILLDAQGRAHVTDFGIAQADDATSLTQTGMVVGTIKYLAPEVSTGGQATVLSDLYAAGMVVREVAAQAPAPAVTILVATLTAADPTRRPASAAAALRLLDADPMPPSVEATAPTRALYPTAATPAESPAATRVQPVDGQGAERQTPPATPSGGSPALTGRAALAATAALVALVIVVIVTLTGGGGGSGEKSTGRAAPAPAQPAAALEQQLDALQRIIDHAAQPPPP